MSNSHRRLRVDVSLLFALCVLPLVTLAYLSGGYLALLTAFVGLGIGIGVAKWM